MNDAIRTIAVAGDGIAAVTAAAALAVRLPGVRVALVRRPANAPAVVDRIAATTPAALPFHADMQWDWRDVLRRSGGAIRLGMQVDGRDDYVHAYGAAGSGAAVPALPAIWARHPARPFHHYVAGARLGLAGKAPSAAPALATAVFGLHLDPARYLAALEGYARHRGVMVAAAPLASVSHDGERVAALHLGDGSYLTADLYVDATGTERLLRPADARASWTDWSRWLPYRHLAVRDLAPAAALPSLDRMTVGEDRLVLHHHLPDRTQQIILDRAPGDGAAALSFGRVDRGWIGNTVAIGEAHVVLPPVQALPFHWLHTGIDRIVALLPGRDAAPVELDHYNRTANEEADRLLDVLLAHFSVQEDSPASLRDTVGQFARRLRWRQRDGEGFSRDDWAQILFGRGIRPAVIEASMPDDGRLLDTVSADLDAAVATAPDHRRFLMELMR